MEKLLCSDWSEITTLRDLEVALGCRIVFQPTPIVIRFTASGQKDREHWEQAKAMLSELFESMRATNDMARELI